MFAQVFKDHDASVKAWDTRGRALENGGKGVGWRNKDGTPLDKPTQDALKRLKGPIPPAWKNVVVNTDPKAELVASGLDAKGRQQKMYSTEHTAGAAAAKFARVAELNSHIKELIKQSTADMLNTKNTPRAQDDAATVNLITKTGFRPGSPKDTGGDVQAYGASTLLKKHIKVNGDDINFSFIGKKGVAITKTLTDPPLASYLSGKLPGMKPSEQVFKTTGASAMEYMRGIVGDQFKLKDLRTWNGTALATHLLKNEAAPTTLKEEAALHKKISTAVAEHLGNTPKIAHDSYINPAVWPRIVKGTAITKDK